MPDLPKARFLDRKSPPHLATLVLMAGVGAMSLNIFLPSLPSMAVDFGVPYAVMQQSISLYLLISGACQLFVGPLADRFGRRPVVLISLVIFMIATIGAMLAPDITTFMICRMVQAAIATCMVLSRAMVRDMVDEAEAASQIAYVTMGMSLIPMFAPALGGLLDDFFGWRGSFSVMLLSGMGVFLLCLYDQGETKAPTPGVSMLDQFRMYPGLLRAVRFWGYSFTATFASGAFFAFMGGAPYISKEIYGLDGFWTGLLFGLSGTGYMIGNYLSGRFTIRVGLNRMVLWGTNVANCGILLLLGLTLAGWSNVYIFFGLSVAIGIGNGFVMPNANAGMVSVRPHLAGTASGLGGAMAIGGGAMMAAIAGTLIGPGRSEVGLILLMLASSLISTLAILVVIRRARALGLST